MIARGVTRTVLLVGPVAVKFPGGYGISDGPHNMALSWLRGWLANQSEWQQRHRPDVADVLFTFGHVALIMRRGKPVPLEAAGAWDDVEAVNLGRMGYSAEESKPSSWAEFNGDWKLIDFDRSWHQDQRGLIGRLYWGWQERLARQWSRLPPPNWGSTD